MRLACRALSYPTSGIRTRIRQIACVLLVAAAVPAIPQTHAYLDSLNLHPRITGQTYQDEKIRVTAPTNWHILYLVSTSGGIYQGAMLSNGKYILRLCTGCRQAFGVSGGRFSEIADLIQPQYRADFLTLPTPCGEMQRTQVSKEMNREDFWYRRDPAHRYNEAENDCREPATTDTVWYGSYFSERCPDSGKIRNCGGYYLHHDYLTRHKPEISDEMVFTLAYDSADLNQLPHQNDPSLQQTLKEASQIVRNIQFQKSPR